ncbi:hypothetical protein [Clostridium sp. 3-3]|uniref:hypothetical protein n=1 Tax=Clostridium sp. 3-3 TaxID=2070757 RepID=UPI000CDB129F|nr:hypothetical protein [Clostridium sp. 3-3]POO87874.1 hypothetical protein C1H59_03665 [Clostridium sp. 3-3]
MIEVKYGLLPTESFEKYFDYLINKTYKILPMKEENSATLKSYLEGFQRELVGNKYLVEVLVNEPRFITVLNIIQYLIAEDYSKIICKKEVFRCIKILEEIQSKYFKERED